MKWIIITFFIFVDWLTTIACLQIAFGDNIPNGLKAILMFPLWMYKKTKRKIIGFGWKNK